LAGVQAVADDEAAVIIHEGDQVDAAILAFEDEGEQVGLPELVGAGAFETADLVGMGPGRDLFELVAGLVQGVGDGRGAGGQCRSAQQHVADALAAPGRIGFLEHEDGPLG
jgi:hypothetical protein